MASIHDLKPHFQEVLRPWVRRLAGCGVTANQVTLAAAVLSLAMGLAIVFAPHSRWVLLSLPGILLLRMALNAVDGMLAREHRQQSRLGAVLNELGDVFADAALYLPLALVPGVEPVLMILIVLLAVISEMTGVLMQALGASRRYDGPMGKSDRAFVLGALGLALGLGLPAGNWLFAAQALLVILLMLTVIHRALRGLEELA